MKLSIVSQVFIAVFLCSGLVGCWPFGNSTTTTTAPPPAPVLTGLDADHLAALDKALACIVGKTINFTGTYYTKYIAEINIDRQAVISSSQFKTNVTGGDELAELTSEDPKVDKWEGDYIKASNAGSTGIGAQESYCFDIEYKKGPFDGPGGMCTMQATAKICEDCTIENAGWVLMCGVNADGSGGKVKAKGSWGL